MYESMIREDLERSRDLRKMSIPPVAIEEIMRGEYGTLDHLDRARFRAEVDLAAEVWLGMTEDERAWFAGPGR